ncbi:MAG TPA: (d)CMP kinase, partial [Chloroflexota bacterium]|nr:(d)CMP kinase [Chloroflexota bacterium]
MARALGYLYLDTGTMYRGVTALAIDAGIDPADEPAVTALARSVRFRFPSLNSAEAVNPPLLANDVD